jgi:hypothetical protein
MLLIEVSFEARDAASGLVGAEEAESVYSTIVQLRSIDA